MPRALQKQHRNPENRAVLPKDSPSSAQSADSDEVARAFQDDVAHHSRMISPGSIIPNIGRSSGALSPAAPMITFSLYSGSILVRVYHFDDAMHMITEELQAAVRGGAAK
jgi:hypothetical protein